MEPVHYLRALRRRAPVIVAATLLAVLVGVLITRGASRASTTSYEATAVLLGSESRQGFGGGQGAGISDLETIAVIATLQDVRDRAAEALGVQDPFLLTSQVKASVSADTGLLNITATASDPEQAELIATTFTEALIAHLTEEQEEDRSEQAAPLRDQIKDLNKEVDQLNREIGTADPSEAAGLTQRLNSTNNQLSTTRAQLNAIEDDPIDPGITLVDPPRAVPVSTSQVGGPISRVGQLLLAALLGLIAGVILALMLERFDPTIRTRQSAERHFGFPVIAEIPLMPSRRLRRRPITLGPRVDSVQADAFRLLRAGVTRGVAPHSPDGLNSDPSEAPLDGPQTILVTSPGPGEGKSTIVANLAATFAEAGKKVLVVSCDFRRPSLHDLFGVPNEPGLSAALRSPNGTRILDTHAFPTTLEDIRIVPSGSLPDKPAELLGSEKMHKAIAEARGEADVILFDTSAFLAGSEAAFLLDAIDAVLVVACAGKTTPDVAELTSRLLKLVRARVVGVALNQSREVRIPKASLRQPANRTPAALGDFPV